MAERAHHLDIAKGIAIVLVAAYHCNITVIGTRIFDDMSLFRLPLFFFISGIFFHPSKNIITFTAKKADSILKPYLITQFFILIFCALAGNANLVWQFFGILYGNSHTIINGWQPLWFLPHLFAIYIFAQLLMKLLNFEQHSLTIKLLGLLALLVLNFYSINTFWYYEFSLFKKTITIPGLPFSTDVIFISLAFFLSGHTLRNYAIELKPNIFYLALALIVYLLIVNLTNARLDLGQRIFNEPTNTIIGAILGIYIILSCSCYLTMNKISKIIFTGFGKSSIFILIFHYFIYTTTMKYMVYLSDILNAHVTAYAAFIISITLPLAIHTFVKKNRTLSLAYLPNR